MRFDVLGPLRVRYGSSDIQISGQLRQQLLALLLVNANATVPAEWLTSALWEEHLTPRTANRLHLLVYRLRQVLDDPERLLGDPGGYRLRVEPDELDAGRFDALVAEASTADEPARRVELLRHALDLWRGVAYQGLDLRELAGEVRRLTEARLVALEHLHEAELDQGRHAAVVDELADLAGANPLRERFPALLMTALAQSGRRADALDAYDRARRALDDELGLEPGPELRDLRQRILVGSTIELEQRSRAPAQPAQLPMDVPGFVGREVELAELDVLSSADETSTVVVTGTPGVGKTSLVRHWAHRARHSFLEGQLYVDLYGYGPNDAAHTAEVLAGFLRALGLAEEAVPPSLAERSARFRGLVEQARMLIVLDNAATADQVRPLLPGTPSCFVLITSRDTLPGLAERDGAYHLGLDLMSAEEARALVARRLGGEYARDDEAVLGDERVTQLIEYCARLPLALRVASERIIEHRGRDLGTVISELADERNALDLLDTGDEQTSVRAVFDWSYRQLDADAAQLFRSFAFTCAHSDHRPTDIGVAAMLGTDDLPETRRLLDTLVRAHLLIPWPGGRYTLHELLRAYAVELAEQACEEQTAVDRLLGYYLHTAAEAVGTIGRDAIVLQHASVPRPTAAPDVFDAAAARSWLDAELPNLICVSQFAQRAGWTDYAADIVDVLRRYLLEVGSSVDDIERLRVVAVSVASSRGTDVSAH